MLNNEQNAALFAVLEGKSIFLTGSPGTGKSYTLKAIIKVLQEANKRIAVTASTGCSAVLINGQTIHSYLRMGVNNDTADQIVMSIKKYKSKFEQLNNLQVLIIDEISMIDNSTFEKISDIFKKIKNVHAKPFGGLQTIFVGDFCQLAPVTGDYAFNTVLWKELALSYIVLKQSIRQQNDKQLQHILEEVRFAKLSSESSEILKSLQNTTFAADVMPTKLYSLNSDVNNINTKEFRQLYKKTNHIDAKDAKIIDCHPDNPVIKYNSETDIFRYHPISNDTKMNKQEYLIDLFKGLYVIVTRNLNFEKGIINGTTGIITTLTPNLVVIQMANNEKYTITYHKDINDNNGMFTRFMPLKLAYALSIHKSQGATLDAIEVDGSTYIFAAGQLYTALSRAKSLDSIRLMNFDKDSFICHRSVKAFYASLNT